VLAAEGYAFARTCRAPDGDVAWSDRVVVVRSPLHATHQAAGLEKRLRHAETQLTALTPPRGLTITHNFRELRERPKRQGVEKKKGVADNML